MMDSTQTAGVAQPAKLGLDDELEALGKIVHAFRKYQTDAEWEVRRWEFNYGRLSPAHKELLPHLPAKAAAARHAIYQNHIFIKSMLCWLSEGGAPEPLCFAAAAGEAWAAQHGPQVHPGDADKVRYVLKNLARDWSSQGQSEREESYGFLCSELGALLAAPLRAFAAGEAEPPKVLVPGCGLARLCVDFAGMGFEALGNEHSYFMLLTSAFVLNAMERSEQFTVFPWVHSCSNQLADADQLRPSFIPDTSPAEILQSASAPGLLGMAAGEFVEVFNTEEYEGYFDAVATCFFIDTAHNVIEYLETIWKALKPGGWWANVGPLQWHWADAHTYLSAEEMSIELSLADMLRIAQRIGFVIVKKETGVRCRYLSNDRSMMHQAYDCATWVAQKPADAAAERVSDSGNGSGGFQQGAVN